MVSEKAVVWFSDPDVAVTVTVVVLGIVPGVPQLVMRVRPIKLTANRSSICIRRRFLKPMQQSVTASTELGNSGPGFRCNCIADAEVVTVSVEFAMFGVVGTVINAKLHAAPAGNPEQANETLELNPFKPVTAIVAVPLCPGVTVIHDGETESVKSGGGKLIVYAALATSLLE
jgi:hypothetical protein